MSSRHYKSTAQTWDRPQTGVSRRENVPDSCARRSQGRSVGVKGQVSKAERGENAAPEAQALVAERGRDGQHREIRPPNRPNRTSRPPSSSSTQSGGHATKSCDQRQRHHWSQSTTNRYKTLKARGQSKQDPPNSNSIKILTTSDTPHVLHFNLLQTHCPRLSQMAIRSEVEHWDIVIVGAGIAGLASVCVQLPKAAN